MQNSNYKYKVDDDTPWVTEPQAFAAVLEFNEFYFLGIRDL